MIEVTRVSKYFPGGVRAVDNVSFRVPKGEIVVLVGPSGCGKTTTLKMINRLVEPDSGEITINGKNIAQWDPIQLRRSIGYIIQETGLLPHHNVTENIGLVPKLKRWDKNRIRERVRKMLNLVGLPPSEFETRYPDQLSGGQKQRVGVARALAADPEILLMDEPFGALDPIMREELQDEFLNLQNTIRKTVVLVTHDIFEAVRLSDQLAIMKDSRIEQIDSADSILEQPKSDFVERFLGRNRQLLKAYLT
jgi:osmoprotectant transport system ATP-binding protein